MIGRITVAVSLVAIAGCSLERRPIARAVDGGGRDAGLDASRDAPPSPDAPDPDAGPLPDSGLDGGSDGGTPVLDGGLDGGGLDAATRDAGTDAPVPDAGIDAGAADAGAADAGPRDAGAADAGTPDAGGTLRGCDAIYGGIGNYSLCSEGATSCRFYMDPSSDTSCNTQCGSVGGTCISAVDNALFTRCTSGFGGSCSENLDDVICTCSRIP